MNRIAIFASGNGSNAQKIAEYFSNINLAKVTMILSNNPDAFVLHRARQFGVATKVFDRKQFYHSEEVLRCLKENKIDLIVLSGFLWLIPDYLIRSYPKKIINIHPALLPKYGGKGMYGDAVHKAVISAGESESGITIHYVNKDYDKGEVIFQARCKIQENDTAEVLAERIHNLEYQHYPKVIEAILTDVPYPTKTG